MALRAWDCPGGICVKGSECLTRSVISATTCTGRPVAAWVRDAEHGFLVGEAVLVWRL